MTAVHKMKGQCSLSFGPWNSTYSSFTLSFTNSTFQSLIILRRDKKLIPVQFKDTGTERPGTRILTTLELGRTVS